MKSFIHRLWIDYEAKIACADNSIDTFATRNVLLMNCTFDMEHVRDIMLTAGTFKTTVRLWTLDEFCKNFRGTIFVRELEYL
jgi:hypothetical protein